MVVRYVITPYDPISWDEDKIAEHGTPSSDLRVKLTKLYKMRNEGWFITIADNYGGTLSTMMQACLYFNLIENNILTIEIASSGGFSPFVHH